MNDRAPTVTRSFDFDRVIERRGTHASKWDLIARYSGIGDPAQSAVFYSATPTLDPAAELLATGGQLK